MARLIHVSHWPLAAAAMVKIIVGMNHAQRKRASAWENWSASSPPDCGSEYAVKTPEPGRYMLRIAPREVMLRFEGLLAEE
jgi:hypothetical protein